MASDEQMQRICAATLSQLATATMQNDFEADDANTFQCFWLNARTLSPGPQDAFFDEAPTICNQILETRKKDLFSLIEKYDSPQSPLPLPSGVQLQVPASDERATHRKRFLYLLSALYDFLAHLTATDPPTPLADWHDFAKWPGSVRDLPTRFVKDHVKYPHAIALIRNIRAKVGWQVVITIAKELDRDSRIPRKSESDIEGEAYSKHISKLYSMFGTAAQWEKHVGLLIVIAKGKARDALESCEQLPRPLPPNLPDPASDELEDEAVLKNAIKKIEDYNKTLLPEYCCILEGIAAGRSAEDIARDCKVTVGTVHIVATGFLQYLQFLRPDNE